MMSAVEVVRAGAGSGKTADLCATIADAVARGLDPARIFATTFTRKAAAELKGRIATRLLEDSCSDHSVTRRIADRLELAAIGTVHSVAHRLIVRYALPLGLSPRQTILEDTASDRTLRDLLGMMAVDTLDSFSAVANRLGVPEPHQLVLRVLAAKRGNRISEDEFRAQMVANANRVCELLSPGGPDVEPLVIDQLFDLAEKALTSIAALTNDTTQDTQKARQVLGRMCARREASWSAYVQARNLKAGKRSGADGHLHPLRTHAARIRENPDLHAEILLFANMLVEQVAKLDALYLTYKRERGYVDFTDLELLLLSLLENDALIAAFRHDFDLVLVDEFQDTNPLQLAIFQSLRKLVKRSRWVGDPKQAIYGFRNTDPQLVNVAWNIACNASRIELPNNHRAQKGIVQLIGALFEPVFGPEARQSPVRGPLTRGIERWILATKNQQEDSLALASGIARLRAEGVRLGDIVVLERSNRLLQTLAQGLDSLAVPYLIESPGLLATREGALILAGMRLVADRNDALAAATVIHILSPPSATTPEWLAERLSAVLSAGEVRGEAAGTIASFLPPWADDPRLSLIDEIDSRILSPLIVVQRVIKALDLPALVGRWGDAARRCSHIDSLLRHAAEYESISLERGQAATLTGLIVYLEQLAREEKDMRHPPLGHDAVTLLTYHSAKGLEWPVVILSGLNSHREPDLWSPVVTGASTDVEKPLSDRILRCWIWPFGYSDGPFPDLLSGSGLEDDALNSPEGREHAQREMEESIRLLYVGFTRAKDKLVLAHRNGKCSWLQLLPTIDSVLNTALDEGEHPLPEMDTTYVVRKLSHTMADSCRLVARDQERWLRSDIPADFAARSPRYYHPTAAPSRPASLPLQVEQLPGLSHFPSGAGEESYPDIGNAVHAYFAALPSMTSLATRQKQAVAERCLTGFSVTGLITAKTLVDCGVRFEQWVSSTYAGARWYTEVPITAPHVEGGQWTGTIDLLLCLPDEDVIVIDHKSAPIRREDCPTKAATFAGQVGAYREILEANGHHVRAVWIHFPLPGVLAAIR